MPLLPVYAHDLGASGFFVGMIFGAFSLSRTFFLPYFGRLSDKKGRKPFIVPGLLAYALISVAFIYSSNVNSLIIIRFFQGIASAMLMPVIQAYIGDITPGGREGFIMGSFNMSMFIGLSLGPLLGGIIKDQFSLQASFICMGVLAMIGFFLSFTLLPPTKSEQVFKTHRLPVPWRKIVFNGQIAGLFVFRFGHIACIGIIWGFVPIYADVRFSLSSSSIGILIMLGVLVSGLIHVPMGLLADRLNRKMMIVFGGVVACYAILSFEWANTFRDMIQAAIIFGLGGGISMPALMAMAVSEGNKSKAMGSVMALMTVAHSTGMLTGALLGGFIMDCFQLRMAFPAGAVLMALSTALFILGTSGSKVVV